MTRSQRPHMIWDKNRRNLKIEVDGAIINITQGVRCNGNSANSTLITVAADGDRYADQAPWWIEGSERKDFQSIRIIQKDSDQSRTGMGDRASERKGLPRARKLRRPTEAKA